MSLAPHLERRAEGGRRPTPGSRSVFEFKLDEFQDHSKARALRAYMTNQDITKPTLQPLWSYQFYVTHDIADLDAERFVKDVFRNVLDVQNYKGIRLEFFFVPPGFTREQCAEHFREKAAARCTSALPVPNYLDAGAAYRGRIFIIRDPAHWMPTGVEHYLFDVDESYRAEDGSAVPVEIVRDKIWVERLVDWSLDCVEVIPLGYHPLAPSLNDVWRDHPKREKIMDRLEEARHRGRTSWVGARIPEIVRWSNKL